ncbi:hypothetical protein DQ04_04851000 [Trypanosoma grayi]|uniref:hypothetical protein n=1 Tax=Trypanosoma grayi TaxID=71804 RepID=UPI0004F48C71|nr:hypothetical protein DQ04_04851000 [Trypanosoma grayi]KEG09658.1 hypothetical protein DQ04_04851000 [Trypanosoma grayi]
MTKGWGAASVEQRNGQDETTELVAFRGGILPELNNGLQRVGHTIVVYKHDLYLYGGYGLKNSYSTSIFCNVKMTLQWREIRGVGVVPSGRANHTALVHDSKMIVFGGHRNLEVFDDLYILSLETMRWEKVNYDQAQGPGPVFSHAAVYVPPTQTMIIIGGFHQRQHNMYVAHSYDIHHRVWNGIRGPDSVNPHHLQMCTAAYHNPTTSLIVIGMVEKDVLTSPSCDVPTVHMMNVHSGVWVEVNTPASPETPIPFRISGVWEYFIREVISMGGAYDDKRQEWYFPLLLAPIENCLGRRRADRSSSISTTDSRARPKTKSKSTTYGFFKLQLRDMTWSIVPTKFPKRVIAELMARKMSKHTGQPERQSAASQRKPKTSSGKKHLLPLYSVGGVSRFQHKYAFVAIDPSGARRQHSGHKLIVMHGGMSPEDYVMLLFTPILKKTVVSSPSNIDSFVAFSESETTMTISPFWQTSTSAEQSTSLWDEHSDSEGELSRLIADGTQKKESIPTIEDDVDSNIMLGRLRHTNSDPTLLPILPTTRNAKNVNRFAVLYHPRSAVHSDKLLPDSVCPVAVMEKEADVKTWAENFYSETRQWIATHIAAAREEERAARRNNRKGRHLKKLSGAEAEGDDSSDTGSDVSRDSGETKTKQTSTARTSLHPQKPKDFFLDKNLEVFGLSKWEVRRASYYNKSPFLLPGETLDTIGRLRMAVKRNPEVQRLPSTVFQRASLGNVTDIGGATAYLLMEAALARFEDGSQESKRQRAIIRWRYLRVMVLNGEAAFIMHRARQDEGRGNGVDVSSTEQLALVPELHTKGATPTKVTARPIPYAVPSLPIHTVRSSEMTPSGFVMYHCVKNVK